MGREGKGRQPVFSYTPVTAFLLDPRIKVLTSPPPPPPSPQDRFVTPERPLEIRNAFVG